MIVNKILLLLCLGERTLWLHYIIQQNWRISLVSEAIRLNLPLHFNFPISAICASLEPTIERNISRVHFLVRKDRKEFTELPREFTPL